MTRPLIIRPEAEADADEVALWYEEQRPGLGLRFLTALDMVFGRIAEAPLQFPELEDGVRRGLLSRFPFGVYFVAEQERAVVLAVLHLHRHPDTWKDRK